MTAAPRFREVPAPAPHRRGGLALRLVAAAAAALAAGCPPPQDENQGIAVGNPGVVSLSIAASTDVVLEEATVEPSRLRYGSCGGADASHAPGDPADLAAEPAEYPFPAGTWCGVRLEGVPTLLRGRWEPGTGEEATFALELDVPEVTLGFVDDLYEVTDATELALELGSPDWLGADALGLADGAQVEVAPGDALHDELVAALEEESAAFDDLDGSGVVEEPERSEGPLAVAAEIRFDDGPVPSGAGAAACSCDAGPGEAPGLGAVAAMLLGTLLLGALRARGRGGAHRAGQSS